MRKLLLIPAAAAVLLLAGCVQSASPADPAPEPTKEPAVEVKESPVYEVVLDEGGFPWNIAQQFAGEYPPRCVTAEPLSTAVIDELNASAKTSEKIFEAHAMATEDPGVWLISAVMGTPTKGAGVFFYAEGDSVESLSNFIAADAGSRVTFDVRSDLTTKDTDGAKAAETFATYAGCFFPLYEEPVMPELEIDPDAEIPVSDVVAE